MGRTGRIRKGDPPGKSGDAFDDTILPSDAGRSPLDWGLAVAILAGIVIGAAVAMISESSR